MAYEGAPIPFVGPMLEALLGSGVAPGGEMTPQLYNVFGAMHGTIMVFMGIVPAAFAAFAGCWKPALSSHSLEPVWTFSLSRDSSRKILVSSLLVRRFLISFTTRSCLSPVTSWEALPS